MDCGNVLIVRYLYSSEFHFESGEWHLIALSMEDFDELDGFDDVLDGSLDSNYKGKIPATLLALCIMTIVGSGFVLVKDLITYEFYSGFQGVEWFYLAEGLSCIGSITGAILMIRLKKAGFLIYLVSTIVYIIAVAWFWFGFLMVPFNEWFVLILLVYIAVPAVFIILYSAQQKYLH